jgi:hypothetical protein
MRRKAWAVTAALGTVLLVVAWALPASAAPSPVPLPSPSPGTAQCTVDKELVGLTGLVVTSNGYAVTVKGGVPISVKIYLLDNECRRSRTLAYNAGSGPRDPQDIQIDGSGNYWVADTGDDPVTPARTSVAVWKVTTEGRATLYRFSFPDREQSAQALLLGGDGNPVIIADNPKGPAGIYVPSAALDANRTILLKKAGEFTPQDTGTENKLGKIGTSRVTGAANSHDGKHVAVRTFADAYEWSVTNGDVVGALTTGTPKITPLPNEPQGAALAYSRDGASFLTVSDLQAGAPAQMLKYKVSPPAAAAKPAPVAPAIAGKGDTRSWFGKLNLQDLLRIVGAVGVLGLVMVVGGIIGIRQARKRARLAALAARRQGPPPVDDPDLMNGPTAGLAQVSTGPPQERRGGRYGDDRYDGGPRYQAAEPPYGGGYDPYGAPPPRATPPTSGPPTSGPPPTGRRDRGIARSHRPGNRRGRDRDRDNGDPTRRGYSDQHDGFGDILDQ